MDVWYLGSRQISKWSVTSKTEKYGYIEATHTPGSWKHVWKPISWTLIVDDFVFKYTNKRHVEELLKIMLQWYGMKMGLEGKLRRYYPQVKLWRRAMCRTLPPRICWENPRKILPYPTKKTTRLPTSSSTHQNPHEQHQRRHPPTNPPVLTKRE